MSFNIIKRKDLVTRTVIYYLENEMQPHGLLSDVETFLKFYLSDETKSVPFVWMLEHPTISQPNKPNNLSRKQLLQTTFEFVCVDYSDDLDEAQLKSQNLATRVGASILKNFNKLKVPDDDSTRLFNNVEFEALYPVGDGITIQGKSDKVPATSIVFKFNYMIDWLKCMKGEK